MALDFLWTDEFRMKTTDVECQWLHGAKEIMNGSLYDRIQRLTMVIRTRLRLLSVSCTLFRAKIAAGSVRNVISQYGTRRPF